MKIRRSIEKHIEHRYVYSKTLCDICRKEVNSDTDNNYNDTSLEFRIGNIWPEGDFRELYFLDLCEDCFLLKIKPLIEETFKVKFGEIANDDDYPQYRGVDEQV